MTEDLQVAIEPRPWTPAPWHHTDDQEVVNPGGTECIMWMSGTMPDQVANRELVALAPEMAEAILAWARWLELDATCDYEAVMRPVLDKLRAIGGAS